MRNKSENDIIKEFCLFEDDVIKHKPPMNQMIHEVQMMKFKIKPLQGDFSFLNFSKDSFIESLWSLGKLDEFYRKTYPSVKKQEKAIFLSLFEGFQKAFQEDLKNISLKKMDFKNLPITEYFEMEIYRDSHKKKIKN